MVRHIGRYPAAAHRPSKRAGIAGKKMGGLSRPRLSVREQAGTFTESAGDAALRAMRQERQSDEADVARCRAGVR